MLNHLVFFFCFFFLRLGLGQRRAVVIIGRWLLPSLMDTGDICCHYWQHILVSAGAFRNIQGNLDTSVVCILICAGSPRNIQGNLAGAFRNIQSSK